MRGIFSKDQWFGHSIALIGMVCAWAFAASVTVPSAQAAELAALPASEKPQPVALPEVLSDADARKYKRLFALQEKGDWRRANKLIKQLDSRLLLGHLQAQRYLHPTKYRSRYIELAKWLKSYADHPDARRIYKLALKRRPRNYRAPRRPASKFYPSYQPSTIIENSGYRPGKRSARRIISRVRRMTYQRRLTAATRYISGKTVQRRLGRTGLDLARTHIASGWFFYGDGKKAYRMASREAARSGKSMP